MEQAEQNLVELFNQALNNGIKIGRCEHNTIEWGGFDKKPRCSECGAALKLVEDDTTPWQCLQDVNPALVDYEALEGRMAKIVHPDFIGGIGIKLARNNSFAPHESNGWASGRTWGLSTFKLFNAAWHGIDGWELHIQGTIPTRPAQPRATAETLSNMEIAKIEHKSDTGKPIQFYVINMGGTLIILGKPETLGTNRKVWNIVKNYGLNLEAALKAQEEEKVAF